VLVGPGYGAPDFERENAFTPATASPTDQCASNPSWSPDGRTILHLAGECGGWAHASVMSSEGAHPRSITDVPVLWPHWSSRGRIVHQAQVPGSSGGALFVADDTGADPRPVDLDTGHLEPLAATACQRLFPDWRR
jgi:hypothetical protein